ncbi:Uncharacterized protein ACO02O_03681 [Dirofilaria immitis]
MPRRLWEHKKKSAVAFALSYFTSWKIYCWKRDCDIRTVYAREAKQFGDIPLTSAGHLRRVAVLVDTTCTSAFDSFKKNALPLFNLAGLQVEIIRPTDISEFKTIAEHIDTTECDALYVIGGDNALSCVLSAMYRQKNNSPVPIGVFPSGAENRSLIGLVSNVFSIQNDIRPCCESAMALIEEKIRPIYLSSIRFENSESNTNEEKQSLYGVSGLHVGWYDRVEANKNKLWYWGRLKRWIAYITATLRSLKQYPEIELDMVCEEYCAGCCKCRSQAITEEIKQQTNKHWWHYIIGSRNYTAVNGMKPKMDYSIIKNENCGKTREMKVKAVDITIENIQDQNACGIRIRTGGAGRSRISLLMDGWMRCQTKQLSASPNTDFYQNDLHVKSVVLTFNLLQDAFRKITYVKKWIGLPDFDKLEWDMIHDKISPNEKAHTSDKDSKSPKKEAKRLPKVDEELHAKTIFEPVSAEVRPAKTKPKARSKLKWKEGLEPKGKTEESKDSDINSDQAIRLNVKIKKESDQMKVATKDKSDRSIYVKKWIGLPDFDKLEWDMIHDKISPNEKAHTSDKDSKSPKKEAKRLPKVDEELHAKTIFEPVSAEVRPAKTKPKARSKLKWKEGLEPKGKTEESKDSDINSDQAIRLNVKIKKESDQMKVATKDKSDRSIEQSNDDTGHRLIMRKYGKRDHSCVTP